MHDCRRASMMLILTTFRDKRILYFSWCRYWYNHMSCIFLVQKYIGFPGGMFTSQITIQKFIKEDFTGDWGHGDLYFLYSWNYCSESLRRRCNEEARTHLVQRANWMLQISFKGIYLAKDPVRNIRENTKTIDKHRLGPRKFKIQNKSTNLKNSEKS